MIVSGGISAAKPFYVSAEASVGWVPIAPLGIIARASANAAERDGWTDLQLGVRWWPFRAEAPGFSLEAHGGRASVSEEYDCIPVGGLDNIQCTGGDAKGTSWGGTLRVALVRGRHASFDLTAGYESVRFRDASMDIRETWSSVRVGLGLSFY